MLKDGLDECSGEGAAEYVETRGKRNEIEIDIL